MARFRAMCACDGRPRGGFSLSWSGKRLAASWLAPLDWGRAVETAGAPRGGKGTPPLPRGGGLSRTGKGANGAPAPPDGAGAWAASGATEYAAAACRLTTRV